MNTFNCHVITPTLTAYFVNTFLHSFIYRVPQVLIYYGVIKYSDKLMELLKSGKQHQDSKDHDFSFTHGLTNWCYFISCRQAS
jgi:hypothetical protein